MTLGLTATAKDARDLEYAEAVMTWALEHLDRVDLTHAQRRAVERELRGALEMRSLIHDRGHAAAVPPA
jgi:hypothetical protein